MERTTERGVGGKCSRGNRTPTVEAQQEKSTPTPSPPTIRQRIKETMTPKKIFRLLSSQSIQKNHCLHGGVSVECM